MAESPVINDSDDFVPMNPEAVPDQGAPVQELSDSPVIDDPTEFVPMEPPRGAITIDPTTGGIIRGVDPSQVDRPGALKRLDSVPFEFADIRALAQRILKRAQEQGQAKIDSARKQVEAMEKEAYDKAYKEAFPKGQEEGYQKGLKDGIAESTQKITIAIESEKDSLRQNAEPTSLVMQQLIEALDASRAQLIAQAEGDLLLLSIDLAKRLVGHELSIDPEAIKPLAIECVGLVTDRTSITARVNPEDFRIMQELLPELKMIFTDLGPLQIVPDQSIERGGIVAATREAEVDMRLATRLAAFEDVILGYSGDDAIAPWSQIPADAIAAAKAANAESPYSLEALADDGSPAPEADFDPAMDAAAEPRSLEGMDTGGTENAETLQDLAELEGLIEGDDAEAPPPEATPPPEPAPAGESTEADPDLADLAALADMTEQPPE